MKLGRKEVRKEGRKEGRKGKLYAGHQKLLFELY
jgi:hypothetical protein